MAAGSHFEGLLTFRGAARVNGSIVGKIHAAGLLVIGPDAQVRAEIDVDELIVEGLVEGDIRVHRRAELMPMGRVIGGLLSPQIKMAEGSVLQGQCRTMAPEDFPATGSESPQNAQAPDSVAESA
ncbi:MAG: polymer-forming cytoskeletal protein [bacterium]|nr:polymer-forming cytoskeletal protein [bacterium]